MSPNDSDAGRPDDERISKKPFGDSARPRPDDAISDRPFARERGSRGIRSDRSRSIEKAGGMSLTIVWLMVGIVGFFGITFVVGFAWYLFVTQPPAVNVAAPIAVAKVEAPQPHPKDRIAEVKVAAVPEAVKVKFKDGVFVTKLENRGGNDNFNPWGHSFEWKVKANTIYWIHSSDSLTPPHVQIPREWQSRDNQWNGTAFLAPQDGTVKASVGANGDRAITVTIREVKDTDSLPVALRLKDTPRHLPGTIVDDKSLAPDDKTQGDWKIAGYAIDPHNQFFWVAYGNRTLSLRDRTTLRQQGNFATGSTTFHVLAVDGKGRLFGQSDEVRKEYFDPRERRVGDIGVWENLNPTKIDESLPPPTKTIALRGIVSRFVCAPGGDWIYFLDAHNRTLGRIDPATATIDKVNKEISPGANSFCVTPDGKTIYCCADLGKIDAIDAATFALKRTISTGDGTKRLRDVSATNGGLVYALSERENGFNDLATVVDFSRPANEPNKGVSIDLAFSASSVAVLPDERAVLFADGHQMAICGITHRAGVVGLQKRTFSTQRNTFHPSRLTVSPDSRLVLHGSGAVFSLDR